MSSKDKHVDLAYYYFRKTDEADTIKVESLPKSMQMLLEKLDKVEWTGMNGILRIYKEIKEDALKFDPPLKLRDKKDQEIYNELKKLYINGFIKFAIINEDMDAKLEILLELMESTYF